MMIAASSVLFISCGIEGPQGLQGVAGVDGVDGVNGADGVNGINGVDGVDGLDGQDANSSCLTCHTIANFDKKIAEYQLSKHYYGTTSSRNTKWCAKCHTSEGFQEVQTNGTFVPRNDIPNANRINCKTCHQHSGFDFSGDTASQVLYTNDPVFLNYDNNEVATDFGPINNLCVNCHQIRGATATVYSDTTLDPDVINAPFNQLPYFPISNTSDDDTVQYLTGRSFSVHYGHQSNLFSGINGYEYQGVNYTRTWEHSSNSCVDCHMNTWDEGSQTGGHTLMPNMGECLDCHGDDKITPIQDAISAKIVELAELLTDRRVMRKSTNSSGVVSYSILQTHDFNGKLYLYTPTQTGEIYASNSTNNTVSATTGLVVYGINIKYGTDSYFDKRIGRAWKYGEFGAAYNYGYVRSELSLGVHNPVYAMQLLQSSIDWLTANP